MSCMNKGQTRDGWIGGELNGSIQAWLVVVVRVGKVYFANGLLKPAKENKRNA